MSLRDQLQAIYDNHGKLTPGLVVDEARPVDHPLHDRFEWNDQIAGEAWRREQASQMIRSVKVVYKDPSGSGSLSSVRKYHALRTENGYTYEPIEKVQADPVMTEIVLRDMEREWKQLYEKYKTFTEFMEIVERDMAVLAG